MAKPKAETLERKIYFYALDAGQQKNGQANGFDPVPILEHIAGLPFKMTGRYMDVGQGNAVFVKPHSLEYPQKLVFVLSRRTNLPESELEGGFTPIQLPDGGGLGEKTHVMFFGKYAAADFNFYGPRATKLSTYFAVKAKGIGNRVNLEHLVRGEAVDDLKKLEGIVVARFKLREDAMRLVRAADKSLAAAFRACFRASDSDELELVLRKKRDKKNKGAARYLSRDVFKGIRRLAANPETYHEFDRLITEGVNGETAEKEEVNILDDKLILTRRIVKTDKRSRAVDTDSAFAEIADAFNEVLPRLKSTAALRKN